MTQDIEAVRAEVRALIARALNLAPERLAEELSPDTVAEWDSLGHMGIVEALEERYGLSIAQETSVELLGDEKIVRLVVEATGTTPAAVSPARPASGPHPVE